MLNWIIEERSVMHIGAYSVPNVAPRGGEDEADIEDVQSPHWKLLRGLGKSTGAQHEGIFY